MATELLPVASGAATSADVTVASYGKLTICLKGVAGNNIDPRAQVKLQIKSDAGDYIDTVNIGSESEEGVPYVCISAPGTWRVRRVDNGVAVGAFYST